jgi:hypothetical protein
MRVCDCGAPRCEREGCQDKPTPPPPTEWARCEVHEGLLAVGRQRAFCAYCGGLTQRAPDHDGRTRCAGHKGLELDAAPIPVHALPMPDRRHTPTCRVCGGTGDVFPGVECSNCDGVGRMQQAALRREAVTPMNGEETAP